MDVNDLVQSLFVGVTAQVQAFGRIDLHSTVTVSNMARNRFFLYDTPHTNDGNTCMFHNLPDELQLSAFICAMEHTPDTRESNTNALACQYQTKGDKQELANQEVLKGASNEYS